MRDSNGELIQAKSMLKTTTGSSELAEGMTMKEALSWIKSNAWRQVIIETDSLTIVQALRSKIAMVSPFGSVIDECKGIMMGLNDSS